MSLLESTPAGLTKRAWHFVRVDHGAARGARRWENSERLYLNAGEAIRWIVTFPLGSKLYEWDGRYWRNVSFPSRRAGYEE